MNALQRWWYRRQKRLVSVSTPTEANGKCLAPITFVAPGFVPVVEEQTSLRETAPPVEKVTGYAQLVSVVVASGRVCHPNDVGYSSRGVEATYMVPPKYAGWLDSGKWNLIARGSEWKLTEICMRPPT